MMTRREKKEDENDRKKMIGRKAATDGLAVNALPSLPFLGPSGQQRKKHDIYKESARLFITHSYTANKY